MQLQTHDRAGNSSRGSLRLCLVIAAISMVWGCLLPWLSSRPKMQAHLKWLDQRGIDPSAMYYTELEAMEPILERLERRRSAGLRDDREP